MQNPENNVGLLIREDFKASVCESHVIAFTLVSFRNLLPNSKQHWSIYEGDEVKLIKTSEAIFP